MLKPAILIAALALLGIPYRIVVPTALAAESTELMLPSEQRKLENSDDERARLRGQHLTPAQRRRLRARKRAFPRQKQGPPRDPPNSGNFDGDGTPVDHTH